MRITKMAKLTLDGLILLCLFHPVQNSNAMCYSIAGILDRGVFSRQAARIIPSRRSQIFGEKLCCGLISSLNRACSVGA
jgi:hypothetical protein